MSQAKRSRIPNLEDERVFNLSDEDLLLILQERYKSSNVRDINDMTDEEVVKFLISRTKSSYFKTQLNNLLRDLEMIPH